MLSLTNNQEWVIKNNTAAANGATDPIWLNPMALPATDARHEAVMFLKPEVCMMTADKLQKFFAIIDDLCSKFSVEILNIGCLGNQYLGKHGIVNDHYGVMGRISALGMQALTPELQQKVRAEFPTIAPENICGSLEFLQKFPEVTIEKLGEVWEANNLTKTKKLAPGTHAQPMNFMGKEFLIFIGFYPGMAAHYTGAGRSIIVMPVRSTTGWESLRMEMIGDTEPSAATAGSFRNTVLARKAEFGFDAVGKGNNCIHMSAGPLEGMVELVRFASNRSAGSAITYSQTNFGAAMLAAGNSMADLDRLAQNPLLNINGKAISAFDVTEHVDMQQAISTLGTALKAAA